MSAKGEPVRTLVLDHRRDVTLQDVSDVAAARARVELSADTAEMLAARRSEVVEYVRRQSTPAYGFNRGFGHNVGLAVEGDAALLDKLQLNLIRSHAAGTGEPAPVPVVRATMLLRACSLSRGYSGVRPVVVEQIIALLNAGITPVVPRHGSVSASGDLCPMSHVALALLGEGEVFTADDEDSTAGDTSALPRRPAAEALAAAGIAPLSLHMKEGLALNNGVQYLTAIGVLASDDVLEFLRVATIATALGAQVMLGSAQPFRADLHDRRPHRGALVVASWMRALLADSPMQDVHRDKDIDGEVQDPYNLRCAAQILGTCHDLVREARETFAIEANSVTDNPLILAYNGAYVDIVSGGHFHGMPVAVKVYNLIQAMAIAGRLSNMRCARYVDEARNKGLGSDLVWPHIGPGERATSSGLMAAEYSSASLVSYIWGQTTPSHLFSVSTDAGQEDHVSMGAPLALRMLDCLPRMAELLAIELCFAAQAAAIRKASAFFPSKAEIPAGAAAVAATFEADMRRAIEAEEGRPVDVRVEIKKLYPWLDSDRLLSPASEAVLDRIGEVFSPVVEDRSIAPDIARVAALVRSGALSDAARPLLSIDDIEDPSLLELDSTR